MGLENEGVVTEGGGPANTGAGSSPANEELSSEVNWDAYATEADELDEASFVEGDAEIVPETPESPPPQTLPSAPATAETPGVAPPAAPIPPPPATESPQIPASVAPVTPATAPSETDYATWRGEQISKLEGVYKLSDDLAAQLMTEPETVLPKLAAQLHMAVTEAVLHSVNNSLPSVLNSIQSTQSAEQKAFEMFSSVNPDLVDPKYSESILKIGTMYRQVNPNATPDEAVKVIGNMVRTALGLQAPAVPAATSTPPPAPTTTPFVPTRGGGGGVSTGTPVNNPWAELAKDFIDD